MLRKLGSYLTYKASKQIYKQVISPIIDYAGILLIACNKDRKSDLQTIQNDALRFCGKNKGSYRITLNDLHKKANLASLEQRRCVQLLILMYKMSKNVENRKIYARNTRQQNKFEFKMNSKIGTKYQNSPFYKGCKLWDKFSQEIQFCDSLSLFKHEIRPLYKIFYNNLYV